MEIGKPQREFVTEPLEDPFERPEKEQEPEKQPEKVPAAPEREKVPA